MSRYIAELSTFLVNDIWGELSSRIFAVLVREGRLPASVIARHSKLTTRQTQSGLVVLIQQGLVKHYRTAQSLPTEYEVDPFRAYAFVRTGKFITLAEARCGRVAGLAVSKLLELGHARIKDLKASLQDAHNEGPRAVETEREGQNEKSVKSTSMKKQIHWALNRLLRIGFICVLHRAYFRSDADNKAVAEEIVRLRTGYGDQLKTKEKEDLQRQIKEQVEQWNDGYLLNANTQHGKKRSADHLDGGRFTKKTRLANGTANGTTNGYGSEDYYDSDDEQPLDDNTVVRVNNERLLVMLRNEWLTGLTAQTISPTTSKIYATLLARLEPTISKCRRDIDEAAEVAEPSPPSSPLTALQIFQSFDASTIDLEDSIPIIKDNTTFSKTNGTVHDEDNSESDEDGTIDHDDHEHSSSRPNKTNIINTLNAHLNLLTESPHPFLLPLQKSTGGMAYLVPFDSLAKSLRSLTISRIIYKRFGRNAVRITRILLDHGKLDERRIGEFALITPKALRKALMDLQSSGYLDLQEIPRDTLRQPSRTMYFYYFNPERVRHLVLEETYKSMLNCLKRAQAEREKVKNVIEKAERSDVIGREEKYLHTAEREALQKWKEIEDKLLGEVARLDDVVMILRDF